MAKTLVLELPDDLEQQLTAQAQKLNVSLESLILQSLTQSVNQVASVEADPISPLIGTLRLETSDLGENHDQYLSQALQQELKLVE
jgi:hypothetical protein